METLRVPVSAEKLHPLPDQPDGVPWPTRDWPTGEPDVGDADRLGAVVDAAFGDDAREELGITRALVVVQRGRIVVERYGPGIDNIFTGEHADDGPGVKLISWSMAKSMLQIAIGIAQGTHGIDIDAPAPVPEWADGTDPRHDITWAHLLHMASGLDWTEEYSPEKPSDVIAMIFGDGKSDMAAFAAAKGAAQPPATAFVYSSGTTNVLARALQATLGLGADRSGMERWLARNLFGPIGMTSATPRFDDAGTWVASSYVYATARDFARFGLLALRGGTWDGTEIVPRAWIDTARRPVMLPTGHLAGYGSHWWTHDDGLGTFAAHGFEGQRIVCVPDRDLVVVRLGVTPSEVDADPMDPNPVDDHVDEIIACFPG